MNIPRIPGLLPVALLASDSPLPSPAVGDPVRTPQVSQMPMPPGAPVVGAMQLDDVPGRPMSAPLMAGTPRYLLFRNVYNEDLRPPKVIPDATILFQVCGVRRSASRVWSFGGWMCRTCAMHDEQYTR